MPTLAQARGRMVLLNRINENAQLGAPLNWTNNTTGEDAGSGHGRTFDVYVQDHYTDYTGNPEHDKFNEWAATVGQAQSRRLTLNFASGVKDLLLGVYIMDRVLGFFGDKPAAERPRRLGWNLFDYENTVYPTNPYTSATVVALIVDSNRGYTAYPEAFQVAAG